jgi:hypothetical protein
MGAWGDCSVDRPVKDIVSPYPYKTAAEHYAALMAQAKTRGGPRRRAHSCPSGTAGIGAARAASSGPTAATCRRDADGGAPARISTPRRPDELQVGDERAAVDGAFCYPEGLMRWWAEFSIAEIEILVTPHECNSRRASRTTVRKILIGQQHVQKGAAVVRRASFWDGDTLVVWTANVQPWTLSHSMYEYSDKFEVIETIKPGENGSLVVDSTFYDPEAFKQPLHLVTPWNRTAGIDDPKKRYTFIECRVQSTIVNGPDGRPTQLLPTDDGYIDYFGRPWAENWERHFESEAGTQ